MTQPYPSSAAARLEKSARRAGLLAGRSNQEIANVFGHGLHRSTILRDRRQLAELKREVSRLRHQLQPPRQKK